MKLAGKSLCWQNTSTPLKEVPVEQLLWRFCQAAMLHCGHYSGGISPDQDICISGDGTLHFNTMTTQ